MTITEVDGLHLIRGLLLKLAFCRSNLKICRSNLKILLSSFDPVPSHTVSYIARPADLPKSRPYYLSDPSHFTICESQA